MKSLLLGHELVDTKFHLFSGRSSHPRRVTQLQALSTNDVVLTARSEFFAKHRDHPTPRLSISTMEMKKMKKLFKRRSATTLPSSRETQANQMTMTMIYLWWRMLGPKSTQQSVIPS